ncbi:MAG: alpha-glucuronidase family glycosyl hydrolase [Planctomycetia bacterium]|nr:alpha-glucuronidase family glycosyl hydrolase [Planctomycetia bacterium]
MTYRLSFSLAWMMVLLYGAAALAETLNLTHAEVIVAQNASARHVTAARMLVEEIEKRTGVQLPVVNVWRDDLATAIVVGDRAAPSLGGTRFKALPAPDGKTNVAEGYTLRTARENGQAAVFVLGNDDRGVFFGVGRLLRMLEMARGELSLRDDVNLTTSPKYSLRGHQLGYRPKTNSYDAWDLPQWEQYYRDLIVFGANAVELLPPRTDDDATSPHFPRPPLEMMAGMSELADKYALDVWIWYPAMAADYTNPATVESELRAWGEVFAKVPRIDAVFVPGGDPGHTQPKHLLAYLERAKQVLQRTHPQTEMWVSPQGFSQVWLDEFLEILRREQPTWLDGIVFGPQVRISLPELLAQLPKQYPVRRYPDITHSRQCQYPVPDWDFALAVAHGRECINPRPLGEANIFRQLQSGTVGFLTYSEGCNDDVNKTVWSALGWDPDAPVIDALRDYSGYFIDTKWRDDFAQGLLALERNWRAPLASNEQIETTLRQFQAMERAADAKLLANWRFQQALYRAYYDAYEHRRLLRAISDEADALDLLRTADKAGSLAAMDAAEQSLDAAHALPVAPELRAHIVELADALYQSIRLQSSVPRYHAIGVGRGATLDTVDYPLNNRLWMKRRFADLRRNPNEAARRQGLQEIVDWTNPGPGGFYDDLGNYSSQPHLVVGEGFDTDPSFLRSAHAGFAGPDNVSDNDPVDEERWRTSWLDHAEAMNDAPLTMHYEDLDPGATYRLRVVYAGDGPEKRIRLTANDGIEVHPLFDKPSPIRPVEFPIPRAATAEGKLTLQWHREPGRGDNGRGCQVSEVWLIKDEEAQPLAP